MSGQDSPVQKESGASALEAKAMGLALMAACLFCGYQFHQGELTGVGFAWRVLLATFLGASAGKLLGVGLHRLRRNRAR